MTDRTIETSADAATSSDADPGEGMGLATPAARTQGGAGDAGDMRVPGDERASATDPASEIAEGDSEGERSVRAAASNRAEAQSGAGTGLDPDQVPDEGPDAGHRFPETNDAVSRSQATDNAAGAGSGGSSSGGQTPTDSDAAHTLG